MKNTFVILFSFLFPLFLHCQPVISSIEKYTISNGLSNNNINTMLQDSRGYLWIGTWWGLNRYDGRTFKQYTHTGAGQLTHYSIQSLGEDREGNIWITTNLGLSILNPFTETFTSWPRPGKVFIDKGKNAWIFNHDSLCLLSGNRVIKKIIIDVAPPDKKANRYIGDIIEDNHNNLWMSTSFGIRKLDKSTGIITSYIAPYTNDNNPNACTTLYRDAGGDIWAGTWYSGLLKVHEATHSLINFSLDKQYSNAIFGLHDINIDNKNYLLLASNHGLLIAEKGNDKTPFRIIKKVEDTQHGKRSLLSNFSSIMQDRQQNFWIGSDEGLYKIDISRQAFHWIDIPAADQGDLFHSIPDIHYPDSLRYLTSIEGWWKLNIKELSIQKHVLPSKNSELAVYLNQYVLGKNGIWFTSQKGFGFYDLEKNSITDYSEIIGEGKKIPMSGHLVRDHSGKLWISVYRDGLRIFDPVTNKVERLFADSSKENLFRTSIFDLKLDKKGYLWMTITGKLYRINPVDHSFQSFMIPDNESDPILRITKYNRIFILTDQVIYEYKDEKVIPAFPKENTDLTIDLLNEDNSGNLWLKTNNDFYKLSPDLSQMTSYTATTGLNEVNVNELSFYKDNCFVLSKAKLLVFNTSQLDNQNFTGPVRISSVLSNNKKYLLPSDQDKKIQLDFKDRVEIEVAALNFSNESGNRIFYRLQGWDDQWKELINGSVVAYEQLPPGDYTFQTRASNAGMELMSLPTNLSFGINPPWWKRGWFIVIVMLLVTSAAYAIYRYRLAQAIKMESLRTRIATDLHDDIGATLSSISMYSDTVKNQVKEKLPHLEPVLEKMGETSRSMVSNMSDIVWAINPENDDGEKLVYRIEAHTRDLCAIKNIQLHFTSDEKLNDLKLPLEHRKNIYLIFKEVLNNSLKYSHARNTWVSIVRNGSQLVLSIKDDGKGFNPAAVKNGNGLKNVEARAAEIKGNIRIVSAEGSGTEVVLSCGL